jgi:hypothetical protein
VKKERRQTKRLGDSGRGADVIVVCLKFKVENGALNMFARALQRDWLTPKLSGNGLVGIGIRVTHTVQRSRYTKGTRKQTR